MARLPPSSIVLHAPTRKRRHILCALPRTRLPVARHGVTLQVGALMRLFVYAVLSVALAAAASAQRGGGHAGGGHLGGGVSRGGASGGFARGGGLAHSAAARSTAAAWAAGAGHSIRPMAGRPGAGNLSRQLWIARLRALWPLRPHLLLLRMALLVWILGSLLLGRLERLLSFLALLRLAVLVVISALARHHRGLELRRTAASAGGHDRAPRTSSGAASAPPKDTSSAASSEPTLYLIAFNDHNIKPVLAYWWDKSTLHYVTMDRVEKTAPLTTVDRDMSLRLNEERNVTFSLPNPPPSSLKG